MKNNNNRGLQNPLLLNLEVKKMTEKKLIGGMVGIIALWFLASASVLGGIGYLIFKLIEKL